MSELNVDTINEQTAANGVTIDGVSIKDGQVDGVDVSALNTTVSGLSADTNDFDLLATTDSTSTTSAVTYKVQASPMRTSSSFSLYLNRSYNLGDDNQFRGVSNVILMEVGG